MHIEHQIIINTPANPIFKIYQDVANWHTWDIDTKNAALDGAFAVGSRGHLTPAVGRQVPMVLTQVTNERSFTVECKIPLLRMVFEHELLTIGITTQVTHRLKLFGLLRFFVQRSIFEQLNHGLPITLARLKDLAERNYRSTSLGASSD